MSSLLISHDDALLLEVCVELLVEVPGVGRRPPAGHARHVRLGREVLPLVEQQVRRRLVDLLGRDLLQMQRKLDKCDMLSVHLIY